MKLRTFTDIDLNMIPHPSTNDITVLIDEQAIKQSMKNLVMTMHYERKFRSEIGSSVMGLLFETPGPHISALIEQEIIDLMHNFEPRVQIHEVNVIYTPDNNAAHISIWFQIMNIESPQNIQFTLNRVR